MYVHHTRINYKGCNAAFVTLHKPTWANIQYILGEKSAKIGRKKKMPLAERNRLQGFITAMCACLSAIAKTGIKPCNLDSIGLELNIQKWSVHDAFDDEPKGRNHG